MTRFEKIFMWLTILLTIVMLAFAAYKTFTPREIIKPSETDAPIAQAFKCETTLSYFGPPSAGRSTPSKAATACTSAAAEPTKGRITP